MTKHPGGRPTKLTQELVEQARKHVDSFDVSVNTLLPTVEGLALELCVHKDSLYEWAKPCVEDHQHEETCGLRLEFSDMLGDLKNKQAQKLVQNSLLNRYNPTIAKLLLSSKHGYVEKSEVDNTHHGEVTFLNEVPRPKNG